MSGPRIALAPETAGASAAAPEKLTTLDDPSHLEGVPTGVDAATGPDADAESEARTVVRTLVLTDLVDSTRLVESLGDQRASEVFARHDRIARDLLTRHDGLEIDKTDGFLFLFRRPFDAIGYTLDYHRALAQLTAELDVPLAARAAVHLGEVVLRRNNPDDVARGAKPIEVEGLAKPTAARLMSLAGARQTLLSRSAFDLGRRSAVDEERWDESLRWLAHGNYVIKGVDEPVEVFEVGLDGVAPLAAPADSAKARRAVTLSEELVLGWRPAAGQPIPRRPNWTLAERLGEGGFGEVWLARHKSGEARVYKFCFEAERLRSLKREVTLFRLLRDALGQRDDIARILDWSFEEAPYFLEAEYTAGGSFPEWAEAQEGLAKIPLETRLELIAQVAEALAAAHSVGVLHKDVKPENVLITTDPAGRPRIELTDFGIGLLTDHDVLAARGVTAAGFTEMATESASSAGTRLYMAPELVEGKAATVQADVYSLGVMLYQVVVGDFSRALAPGWRREVEDEILAEDIALFVDGAPEKRAHNALDVAERLRSLATRRKRRHVARRSQRRRRIAVAATSLVTLLLAVVSIFALQALRARERESALYQEAVLRRKQAEGLIEFMLGDLREKLEPIGRLDIVAGMGEAMERYFAAVPAEKLSDEELVRRAQALDQIGQVRFELGDLPEAASAFQESLALTQDLAARDPADSERQFQLGQSYFWVGYVLLRSRDLEGAAEHMRAYQQIAEELVRRDPSRDDWRLELAYTHSNIATVQKYDNDLDGARRSLLASEDVLTDLVARQPQWAEELATVRSKLGNVLESRGEIAAALESYEKALAIRQRLYEENSHNAERLRDLATIHYNLGELWRMRGESTTALEHFTVDLELSEKLAHRDPANTDWQREVGLSREKMGRIYCQLGDFEMGIYFVNGGVGILQKLLSLDEDHEEWLVNLATARVSMAWCLRAAGRLKAAEEENHKALELLGTIAADTENLHLAKERARALWLEGQIRKELGDSDAARRAWIRGVEIVEPGVRRGSNLDLLALWVRNLTALGQGELTLAAAARLREAQFHDVEYVEGLGHETDG